MAKAVKTKDNPHGLTARQQAVIIDLVESVKAGKGLNLQASHKKFYSPISARNTATANMKNHDFRLALIEELNASGILGTGGKVTQVLREGLDAYKPTKYGEVEDYPTRLAYAQEINKITGIYAPERTESRSLNLNIDISEEELDRKIKELNDQL